MKKCSKCGRVFPDNDFIGVSGKEVKSCKICRDVYKRSNERRADKIKEYYRKNADKIKEYRVKNADKIKENQADYYIKNADKIKAYQKEYNNKNKGDIVEYNKEYYRKNADKIKEYKADYHRKNADKIKEHKAEYRVKNADKIKEYRVKNADKIKEYTRLYYAKKALYVTYADKLTVDEQAESNAKGELVVRCFRCASKFVPTNGQAQSRVQALLGNLSGECHLYCSQECKDSCSIYNVKYDHAEASYGESALRSPEWAQLVKGRDGFTCQKCGDMGDVQAHHIEPVALRPDLADDLDNGITLCTSCHREVHKREGCDLGYLRRNKVRPC